MKRNLLKAGIIVGFTVTAALSGILLGKDAIVFWTWWLLALVLGIAAMPVTGRLFGHFADKGYLFSKVFAITVSGFTVWFLSACGIILFSRSSCIAVTALLGLGSFFLYEKETKKGIQVLPDKEDLEFVLGEELIFLLVFLIWTYLAGFHPAAYGTEKFMDYGFMEAMMRSNVLPAIDPWYSDGAINYYYGGQYYAVFLTKLTGSSPAMTYNLMRTFVAAFAFALPFSLASQMSRDLHTEQKGSLRKFHILAAGLTGGTAVCFAGNMHYVIYGQIIPMIQRLKGEGAGDAYWFPDATRYIGFNPDVPDKTIHEFPCYSFILGDLHAHVVNIIFVLLLLGILYSYMRTDRESEDFRVFDVLKSGHILAAACLLGIYQFNNYWDFVIYFVVTGGVVVFVNVRRCGGSFVRMLEMTVLQAAELVAVSTIVILPFTLKFIPMVSGVALAKHHSLPHQLAVLWGLPALIGILLIIVVVRERLSAAPEPISAPAAEETEIPEGQQAVQEESAGAADVGVVPDPGKYRFGNFTGRMPVPDLFAVILSLCAMGLVMIPEIVYVRDIYENGNARANTMFKLTYQAYIMFGIVIGYAVWKLLLACKGLILKFLAFILFLLWVWTCGYFGESVKDWFGDVRKTENYKGINAQNFLDIDFSQDASAIRWLKQNVKGTKVVLEANGDSYTGFCRVSASTGLPTVLGWYVHEWLWRNDIADLNKRSADVETIYTSDDVNTVRSLLAQYDVDYIFIGAMEQQKYEDRLQTELLKSMGQVVYENENGNTWIVKL